MPERYVANYGFSPEIVGTNRGTVEQWRCLRNPGFRYQVIASLRRDRSKILSGKGIRARSYLNFGYPFNGQITPSALPSAESITRYQDGFTVFATSGEIVADFPPSVVPLQSPEKS